MKYILPIIIITIFVFAVKSNINIFDTFINGVQQGMKTVVTIFPVILAISVASCMMRASGVTDILTDILSPVTDLFKIPKDILPLALIRPVSGGGALSILSDILKNFGPDSKTGFIACVIMGSTETTFYTLSVYYKNTRVKKNLHIIPAAIFGDIVALLVGVYVSTIFF